MALPMVRSSVLHVPVPRPVANSRQSAFGKPRAVQYRARVCNRSRSLNSFRLPKAACRVGEVAFSSGLFNYWLPGVAVAGRAASRDARLVVARPAG